MPLTRKKSIYSLISATMAFTPLVLSVSCNFVYDDSIDYYQILPTYTAQADQLIALGIKPDYYPLQLDQQDVFSYLKNPKKFMPMQNEDFKNKFAQKINSLIPAKKGISWWNQLALNDGERGSDPEYWQHIGGSFVMYEHYLLDDGIKNIDSSLAPKHINHYRTYLETNFRASRDPFTRMPRVIIESLIDYDKYSKASYATKMIVNHMLDVARKIEGLSITKKAVDGKWAPSGIAINNAAESESWIYNDYVFGKYYHNNFLDNSKFTNSQAAKLILNNNDLVNNGHYLIDSTPTDWIFSAVPMQDKFLAKLFFASTFRPEEQAIQKMTQRIYLGQEARGDLRHHPIYEQQHEIGGAPMFEGAQRNNLLYFYNSSDKITQAFSKGKNDDEISMQAYRYLHDHIDVARFNLLSNARTNANIIIGDLLNRMKIINKIVTKIHNPTYGIFTLAPGAGQSTIQTSSKYSFIYRELGFTQPIPSNFRMIDPIDDIHPYIPASVDDQGYGSLFNMDDNGWWWNLNDASGLVNRSQLFENQFDFGVISVNKAQFDNTKIADKMAIASMYKNTDIDHLDDLKQDYNLWNEGLKSPIAIHMILDQILYQIKNKYQYSDGITENDYVNASFWGDYFNQSFLK